MYQKSSRFFKNFITLQVLKTKSYIMTGVIKALTDKGFGFIAIEGQEKDLFFHSNSLEGVSYNELRQGMTVSFETEMSPKGMNAVNVQVVE